VLIVARDADAGTLQDRYHMLSAHTSDVVYEVDLTGSVVWISDSVERVLGWRSEVLIGTRSWDLLHSDDRARAEVALAEFSTRTTAGFAVTDSRATFRLRHQDGSHRWMSTTASATAVDGVITGLVGSIRDVTLEHEAIASLAASEARYRMLVENSADVVVHSVRGLVQWISPSIERLVGWTADDLMGSPTVQLWHPDDRGKAVALRDAVYQGERGQVTLRFLRKDGAYAWLEATMGPVDPDEGGGMIGTLRDVTGQVIVERALAESEARYRILVDNSVDVVIHTVDGIVEWVSPAVEGLIGWTADDLVGSSTVPLFHPHDLTAALSLRDDVYAGNVGRGVLRFRCKDGTYTWIESVLRPVPGHEGREVVGTLRNVSAQVAAEQALRTSEEQFHLLADNATDVVYLSGPDRVVKWIAPTVTRALGWLPEELVGTVMGDLMHPDDQRATAQARSTAYGGKDPGAPVGGYYFRLRTKTGDYRWMTGTPAVVTAEDGSLLGVVVGLKDVDELVRARDGADLDRARLQATMDSLLDPHVHLVAVRDDAGVVVDFTCADANPSACEYLGKALAELLESRLTVVSPGVAGSGLLPLIINTVETGRPLVLDDFVYVNDITAMKDLHYDFRGVRVGDGLILTWRDITERQETVNAMAASEEEYRLLAENSSDMVVRLRGGVVLWASPSVEDVLGWAPSALVGRHASSFIHPDDVSLAEAEEARVSAGARTVSRFRLRAKDGMFHWVENHARPYVNADDVQDGLVVTTHVVDAEVATERELDWRARHDELTGLLSRQEVIERLTSVGDQRRRAGDEYAVVFCDLDDFKSINDRCGHAAGDELLRAFATRISGTVRSCDMVARFGGDEILIVLDGVRDVDEASGIADKVRVAVKEPVLVVGAQLCSTLSIGVTVARPGESIDAMITRADRAMYAAKNGGRDRVVSLAPDTDDVSIA
jgi:diguanylate cyclase (GGDEF)-like protein/PAS domain S-box-containing protein